MVLSAHLITVERWAALAEISSLLGDEDLWLVAHLAVQRTIQWIRVYDACRMNVWLHRRSLRLPRDAQWAYVKRQLDDSAFVTLLRIDVSTFADMRKYISEEAWYRRTPWARHPAGLGAHRALYRPRSPFFLGAEDCLAMALFYLASTVDQRHLSLVFGVSATNAGTDLRDGLDILLDIVSVHPDAVVRWPSFAEQKDFALLTARRYGGRVPGAPAVNIFGWVDGMVLPIERPVASDREQQLYYSNRTMQHQINNIFVSDSTGCIVWASLNNIGRAHDMTCAYPLICAVRDRACTRPGYTLLGDPGFKGAQDAITTIKDKLPDGTSARVRARHVRWLTSLRQPAEWQFNIFKALWKRFTKPLPNEPNQRARLLRMAVGMHNIVARRCGNQITSFINDAAGMGSVRPAFG